MLRSLVQQGCALPLLQTTWMRASSTTGNNMALIKELREKSQAPISDVKNALVASNWDLGKPLPLFRISVDGSIQWG